MLYWLQSTGGFVRKGTEEVSSTIIIITMKEQISRVLVVTEERVEDRTVV